MAKLIQSESEFKTYLGWYGNCNQTCESFNLENVSDKVMIVYEYTTAGAPAYWKYNVPFAGLQNFTKLECGRAYFIILLKGSNEIDIPHLNVSFHGVNSDLLLTDECEKEASNPDPEPSPTATKSPSEESDDPTDPGDENDEPLTELEFRWNTIEGKKVLQVKNILKPTHDENENRDTVANWSTLYLTTEPVDSYSLDHQFWPDAAVDTNYTQQHGDSITFGGITISFGSEETSSINEAVKYKQLILSKGENVDLVPSPEAEITNENSYAFIYSGDNDDPDNSALLVNPKWPVLVDATDDGDDETDVLDFDALITEFSALAEEDRKPVTTEIIGTITQESISGGFFGVVVSSDDENSEDEKYLPLNIQEELSDHVGKQVKITAGYSKLDDSQSIFMWGTMMFVDTYEIIEDDTDPITLDFDALTQEMVDLEEAERENVSTDLVGDIVSVDLAGGFIGVVVTSDEAVNDPETKYIPVNIQTELTDHVGKQVKITVGYSKPENPNDPDIFQWGKLLFVDTYEILDNEIVFPTTICFSTSGIHGETSGKYELFDEETVSQKFSDAGYDYQAIVDEGINGDNATVNWMASQDSLVKYYHIIDENIENDWWDFIYWDGTKDNGVWQRYDQYKFSDTYDLLNSDGYKFTGGNGGMIPEIFISDISDGQSCPPEQDEEDVIDFGALEIEYESLAEPDRKEETVTGQIVYEDISGGFYGLVTSSIDGGEKFLPINLQDELEGLDGKTLKITLGYSRKNADVSIFMWGTLVYVTEYEILDENGEPLPDDGIVFEVEGSKIFGFDLKIKTETGYLTDNDEEVKIETEKDNIHLPANIVNLIKENIDTCTHLEFKTLPMRSFDKETCGLIEDGKVFRYPIILEKLEENKGARCIVSSITTLYSEIYLEKRKANTNPDVDIHELATNEMNELVGETGFDVSQIIGKTGKDKIVKRRREKAFSRVKDRLSIILESGFDDKMTSITEKTDTEKSNALSGVLEKMLQKSRELTKPVLDESVFGAIPDSDNLNFKNSVKDLFGIVDETKKSGGSIIDSVKTIIKKRPTNSKIKNISQLNEEDKKDLIDSAKEMVKDKECGFEDVTEHIGPSVWMPPSRSISNTVRGLVSDWNQPNYYQSQNKLLPAEKDLNCGTGSYTGLTVDNFKAWCAPTSAAIQLEHLVTYGGLKKPPFINDGYNSALDSNPDLKTIDWNSARGWGNFLLDGPDQRGKVGDPNSVPECSASDFGWYMDTNGKGQYGTSSLIGTGINMIWKGLNEFYARAGWHDLIGMVTHNPVGRLEGSYPKGYHSNTGSPAGDPGHTFKMIKNEIDHNRTVLASFYGWSISVAETDQGHTLEMLETKDTIKYFNFAERKDQSETLGEQYTLENIEEVSNIGDALGHTVVVFGYIQRGSPEDISNGQVDWLLVRDNDHTTEKTIAIPFSGVTANGISGFSNLIATFYVNPKFGRFVDPCLQTQPITISVGAGKSGSPSYDFSMNDEVIVWDEFKLKKGVEYIFERTEDGHPFNILPSEPRTEAYPDNWEPEADWIEGKMALKGNTIKMTIPKDYEGTISYQCGVHLGMKGVFSLDTDEEMICPEDALECPDGMDAVIRDPLDNCNFPPCGFDPVEFKQQHHEWKMNRYFSYKFDFTWNGFGHPDFVGKPVTIYVQGGKIVKVDRALEEGEVEDALFKHKIRYYTITELYNLVHSHYTKSPRPYMIDINYNDEHNYISSVVIDVNKDIVDEEVSFTVENFSETEPIKIL